MRGKEKGQDLLSIYEHLNGALRDVLAAKTLVVVPPPIQGIGNASGFTMQVEIRNGNFDYPLLQGLADTIVKNGNAQSSLQRLSTSFRADVPQLCCLRRSHQGGDARHYGWAGLLGTLRLRRIELCDAVQQIRTNLPGLCAGRLPIFACSPDDIRNLKVKAGDGTMVPLGTVVDVTSIQGPSLISLYNLYPTATIVGGAASGFSSGQALDVMEQIADQTLSPGIGFEWTALSYQEKAVGGQIYFVFALAMLLVYFVLAGQYESWILPLAVLLAVPLALLGTVGALSAAGVANNLYTQIGLILLIALASKNAILIVEYAREKRAEGMDIVEAARRGGALALPADPDDLLRLHPRCAAACAGDRRRRFRPQVDRHIGLQRHDRLDLPRRALRSFLLRRAAAHRGIQKTPHRPTAGFASCGLRARKLSPRRRHAPSGIHSFAPQTIIRWSRPNLWHDDPNIATAAPDIVAGSAAIVITAIIGPIDAACRQNGDGSRRSRDNAARRPAGNARIGQRGQGPADDGACRCGEIYRQRYRSARLDIDIGEKESADQSCSKQ